MWKFLFPFIYWWVLSNQMFYLNGKHPRSVSQISFLISKIHLTSLPWRDTVFYSVTLDFLEWFSTECCKTESKLITSHLYHSANLKL